MPNEEQVAASDAIGAALEKWVEVLPFAADSSGGIGVLGDWVAVVCMMDVNEEGQPVAQYYLAMKNGSSLPHTVDGLLRQGLSEMASNTSED
jgi:hypothetical protein